MIPSRITLEDIDKGTSIVLYQKWDSDTRPYTVSVAFNAGDFSIDLTTSELELVLKLAKMMVKGNYND